MAWRGEGGKDERETKELPEPEKLELYRNGGPLVVGARLI
jgi:hypothetical protein